MSFETARATARMPRPTWDDELPCFVVPLPFARVAVARSKPMLARFFRRWNAGRCRWLLDAFSEHYPTRISQGTGSGPLFHELSQRDDGDRLVQLQTTSGACLLLKPGLIVVGDWRRWPDVAVVIEGDRWVLREAAWVAACRDARAAS